MGDLSDVDYSNEPYHDFIENDAQDNPGADTYFTGPLAIKALDQAGGANYTGAKVSVENQGFIDIMYFRA